MSRPTLVKLLEAGAMPFETPGRHRRLRLSDVLSYQQSSRPADHQHGPGPQHEAGTPAAWQQASNGLLSKAIIASEQVSGKPGQAPPAGLAAFAANALVGIWRRPAPHPDPV